MVRSILIYEFTQAKSCQSVSLRRRSLGQPTTANKLWHTFPIHQTAKIEYLNLFDANLQTQPYFSISFVVFPFMYLAFRTQFILHIEPLRTVYVSLLRRLMCLWHDLYNPSVDVVHQRNCHKCIHTHVYIHTVLLTFCVAVHVVYVYLLVCIEMRNRKENNKNNI